MEVWKDVYFIENGVEYDYRGLYQVNKDGNIKSLKNNNGKEREKILKNMLNNRGYLQIELRKNGKRKIFKIHRLVAHMFCDGYFEGAEVNHKDENKENNCFENLEWCNRKENCNYGTRNERHNEAIKGKNHPQAKKVAQYSKDGELIKIWDYMKQASEKLGISQGSIVQCCKGKYKNKTAGGFIWKYIE